MQSTTIPTQNDLADRLTERFGLLLTQAQLAELLGRSTGGLRYSLCAPSDARTQALKACGRRIGRHGGSRSRSSWRGAHSIAHRCGWSL